MALVDTESGQIPTASPTPYQLMPGLTDEERASLRLDIEKNGIRVPIDVDEDDNILDGHHRAWIAAELDIPCPRRLVTGLTEEQKRAHSVSVNVFRRNLTKDQRREQVARLREMGMSVRAIASATNLPKSTVADDIDQLSESGQLTQPPRTNGSDGRSRPATRPAPAPRQLSPEEQRAVDIAEGHKRFARYITSLTDDWSYFWSFVNGEDRAEIEAHLAAPTLDVIAEIEEQMRAYR